MSRYIVPVDLITVHLVSVEAETHEAAEAKAADLVAADWETHFHHAVDPVVGDAHDEQEWAAEAARWEGLKKAAKDREREGHQTSPRTRRPKPDVPVTKPRTTRTDHHADDTECPPSHKHTSSGQPRTEGCPGRTYSTATCTCGWSTRSDTKTYVDETRRRHLRTDHA
ncbi:hypothetical protein ACIQBJ_29290 [Kitasatospora sp. NPDC088391]|uniref:hypothetical protein n=1 Tax=Kitasatospora sp. NPDC088391 TaxID=3364074 RepID=UPI0037F86D64